MGKAGLTDAHRALLKDLADGALSKKEIALRHKISPDHLSALCTGNIAAGGAVAADFKTEFQKLLSKQTEDTKKLFKENKHLALTKINQRLKNLLPHQATKDMTAELCQILNAMAKLGPNVEIGEMHTHYHLTAEERVNEFRRLVAATSKDVRSRIQGTVGRGSAATSKPTGTRGRGPEKE
jgi:hypothetical protein